MHTNTTILDQTRPDQTRPDQTRPDQTRPSRNFIRIIISLAITAILLLALWHFYPVCFQNNDDKVIMYLTAGYTTGTPAIGVPFCGFLWTGFIALLYRIYDGLPWYALATLAAIGVSEAFICHGFIVSTDRKFSQKIIGIVSFVAIFIFSLMYVSTVLQFMVTAAIVGCASIVTVATYQRMESRAWQIANIAVSVILLACSYSIRKQTGLLALSAVLIILFFELFGEHTGETIKRAAIICTAFFIVMGSNMIYERATGIADFNDYYSKISDWIDYPHLDIEKDTQGIYADAGWDETLFNVVSHWYFMDERLTKENFEIINSGYTSTATLGEKIEDFFSGTKSSAICYPQTLVWIILLVIFNLKEIINRRLDRKALTIDALFVSFLALSFYFGVIQGRFPLRVYETLLLIYFLPSLLIMLQMQSDDEHKIGIVIPVIIFAAVFVSYKFYPDTSIIIASYNSTHYGGRDTEPVSAIKLEQYAMANKENVYVYDGNLALPANPFITYTDDVPSNVLFWGGWLYNSPMYHEQLELNGLDCIFGTDFIDGNIYLCGLAIDDAMVEYVQSLYPDAQPEIVNQLDEIVIYRFTR